MLTYDGGGVPVMQIETATQTPTIHSVSAKGGYSYLLVFAMGPEGGNKPGEFLPGTS